MPRLSSAPSLTPHIAGLASLSPLFPTHPQDCNSAALSVAVVSFLVHATAVVCLSLAFGASSLDISTSSSRSVDQWQFPTGSLGMLAHLMPKSALPPPGSSRELSTSCLASAPKTTPARAKTRVVHPEPPVQLVGSPSHFHRRITQRSQLNSTILAPT